MIHTKPAIFVVTSVTVVALVYSSISTFNLFAVPSEVPGTYKCEVTEDPFQKCCWTEKDPDDPEGIELYYCQTCNRLTGQCSDKYPNLAPTPPTIDPTAPLQGGVLEQPEQPPLFGGQNEGAVPPTGGIEQPPTTTTPQVPPRLPGGGANVPTEGGSAEQPSTPQDDTQGGGLPPIKNQENVPPGGGVAEQPDDDEQEEDPSEGAETAGPLT
jgi:hypothetical protein